MPLNAQADMGRVLAIEPEASQADALRQFVRDELGASWCWCRLPMRQSWPSTGRHRMWCCSVNRSPKSIATACSTICDRRSSQRFHSG